MTDFGGDIIKFLLSIMVSLLGGLVRVLRKLEKPTLGKTFKELLISGFTGIMVYYLIGDVVFVSNNFKVFIIGMSGYSGPAVLDLLEKATIKTLDRLVKK